jgi:hypothetical protein
MAIHKTHKLSTGFVLVVCRKQAGFRGCGTIGFPQVDVDGLKRVFPHDYRVIGARERALARWLSTTFPENLWIMPDWKSFPYRLYTGLCTDCGYWGLGALCCPVDTDLKCLLTCNYHGWFLRKMARRVLWIISAISEGGRLSAF